MSLGCGKLRVKILLHSMCVNSFLLGYRCEKCPCRVCPSGPRILFQLQKEPLFQQFKSPWDAFLCFPPNTDSKLLETVLDYSLPHVKSIRPEFGLFDRREYSGSRSQFSTVCNIQNVFNYTLWAIIATF